MAVMGSIPPDGLTELVVFQLICNGGTEAVVEPSILWGGACNRVPTANQKWRYQVSSCYLSDP